MNMYTTLTFTSVVAWGALVVTSMIFIAVIIETLRPKSDFEKLMNKNDRTRTDWRKVGVIFAIWFVSGWYLFG